MASDPSYQAIGAVVSTTSASSISPVWPTHQTDDIGLMVICATDTISAPIGWSTIAGVGNGFGTSGNIWIQIFYRRATSSSESTQAITAPNANGATARIITFRGCKTSGEPFESIGMSGHNSSKSTTFATGSATSTLANNQMAVFFGSCDSGVSSLTSLANGGGAPLTSFTNRANAINGNFLMVIQTGIRTTTGSSGTLTATKGATSYDATARFYLIGVYPVANNQALTATAVTAGASNQNNVGKLVTSTAVTTTSTLTKLANFVRALTAAITTTAITTTARAITFITTAITTTATLAKTRNVVSNLVASVTSTATRLRAISFTLLSAALYTVANVTQNRGKTLTATAQATIATITKGAGNLRALTVACYTQVTNTRAITMTKAFSVSTTATFKRAFSKLLSALSFLSLTFTKALPHNLLATPTSTPSMQRGFGLVKLASINDGASFNKGVTKGLFALVISTATFVREFLKEWDLLVTSASTLIRAKLVILLATCTTAATQVVKGVYARALTVVVTLATSLQRTLSKTIVFTSLTSAQFIRGFTKLVSAASTSTATKLVNISKPITATATTTAVFVRAFGKIVLALSATIVSLFRAWTRTMTATVATLAAITRDRGHLLLANAVVLTTTMAKGANKLFSLVVAQTLTFKKSVDKTLSYIISEPTILVVREIALRSFGAVVTTTSTLATSKFISAILSVVSTTTATLAKLRFVPKNFIIAVTSTPTIVRASTKQMWVYISAIPFLAFPALFRRLLNAGTITLGATLSKPINKLLNATVALTTTMTKNLARLFQAGLLVTATYKRAVATSLVMISTTSVVLARGFYWAMSTTISSVASVTRTFVARIVYSAGRVYFSLFRKRSHKP